NAISLAFGRSAGGSPVPAYEKMLSEPLVGPLSGAGRDSHATGDSTPRREVYTVTGAVPEPCDVKNDTAAGGWSLIDSGKNPLNVVVVNGGVSPLRACTQKRPGSRML